MARGQSSKESALSFVTSEPNFLKVRGYDMLILTRRVGESLIIGDDVVVNVLGVKGNQVRIGVDAPKDVTVHREEIYDRIQAEKDQPNLG